MITPISKCLSLSISLYLIQIDQFCIQPSRYMTRKNNENYSQYTKDSKHCQRFVFNADEVSIEALLDPNFRPMTTYEQQQQQQLPQQQTQAYYQTYHRSLSTAKAPIPYERASFDPLTDLSKPYQPFSTIPTRRRHQQQPHPIVNNVSIIHL